MRIYTLSGTDIYSHLAAEAYFLHHCKEDVILLWQSHNTVVCGKHQNTAAEVNFEYCQQNNIHIARRLTGGGTVFHDDGNVCFTFIQNHSGKVENTIDYKRFLDPVKAFFNALAIPVHYSPRHDLMIDNKKISGNAQHVFLKEKRVLHHGTLLFNSDLKKLGIAINPKEGVEHRGVNSVRSVVANISEYANPWTSPVQMLEAMQSYFIDLGYRAQELEHKEQKEIQALRDKKFSQLDWVWDYSPKHYIKRHFTFEGLIYSVNATIKNGNIEELEIGDGEMLKFGDLCKNLLGSWRFDRISALIQKSELHPIQKELSYLFF